jgi:hypothetical protein
MSVQLSDERRAALAALAESLIPGDGAMPSASAAGVAERWIDRALGSRPDLADCLVETLDAAAGTDPAVYLAELERLQPDRLKALQLLVAGSYFMSPRTRKRIGYPGQVRNPIAPDEAEFYEEAPLLDPVRARGVAYVAVDEPRTEA